MTFIGGGVKGVLRELKNMLTAKLGKGMQRRFGGSL